MLLHQLTAPGSGFDIEQMVVRMFEAVDPVALRLAWTRLIARHDVFRTSFSWEGLLEPVQTVQSEVQLPWIEEDWSSREPAQYEALLSGYLAEDRRRGFDPKAAPLVRCALFRCGQRDWTFVWTFHHMLADGQSYPGLIREAFAHYEAACQGRELTLPALPAYRDFSGKGTIGSARLPRRKRSGRSRSKDLPRPHRYPPHPRLLRASGTRNNPSRSPSRDRTT
jgi:hypothetical protein